MPRKSKVTITEYLQIILNDKQQLNDCSRFKKIVSSRNFKYDGDAFCNIINSFIELLDIKFYLHTCTFCSNIT